jgi:hypothetical protein
MVIARLAIFFCLLSAAPAAFAADPHPPALNVSFLAQPSPIVQSGQTRLFYEMLITNFSKNRYVLDAIEMGAGDAQAKISGAALSPLILHLGAALSSSSCLISANHLRPAPSPIRSMWSPSKTSRTTSCSRRCR